MPIREFLELFRVKDFTALLRVCMSEEPNPQLFGLTAPFSKNLAEDVHPEPSESGLPSAMRPEEGTEEGMRQREPGARDGQGRVFLREKESLLAGGKGEGGSEEGDKERKGKETVKGEERRGKEERRKP